MQFSIATVCSPRAERTRRPCRSCWAQKSQAISGKFRGEKLARLALTHTSWGDWKSIHPDTLVLSTDTGYARDYTRNPYQGYEKSRTLYFQVSHRAPDSYHPKEVVVGLNVDGVYKAYPFVELDRQGKARFSDSINGTRFDFEWDSRNRSVTITDDRGVAVAGIQGFWFAWFAFHPNTEVFRAADG